MCSPAQAGIQCPTQRCLISSGPRPAPGNACLQLIRPMSAKTQPASCPHPLRPRAAHAALHAPPPASPVDAAAGSIRVRRTSRGWWKVMSRGINARQFPRVPVPMPPIAHQSAPSVGRGLLRLMLRHARPIHPACWMHATTTSHRACSRARRRCC